MEQMIEKILALPLLIMEAIASIFSGAVSWTEIPQALSVLLNAAPYVSIAIIAALAFLAFWGYKLYKPMCAVGGAVTFGMLAITLLQTFTTLEPVVAEVISLYGIIALAAALLGALLFYSCARFITALGAGFVVFELLGSAINGASITASLIAGTTPGIGALIAGALAGILVLVLLFAFFKKIYLFITCILGMLIAGAIAGLTVTFGAITWVSWVALGVFAVIGLIIGIAIFCRHFKEDRKIKY